VGPGRNSPRFRRQRRILGVGIAAICAPVLLLVGIVIYVESGVSESPKPVDESPKWTAAWATPITAEEQMQGRAALCEANFNYMSAMDVLEKTWQVEPYRANHIIHDANQEYLARRLDPDNCPRYLAAMKLPAPSESAN
jgi:hypothetical protein